MSLPREESQRFSRFNKKESNDKDHRRIYIGNLDYETKSFEVRQVFQKYGDILSIQIRLGFAFIVYRNLFRNTPHKKRPATPVTK